jgi:hypothetical protein
MGQPSRVRHLPSCTVFTLLLITTCVCNWGVVAARVVVIERGCRHTLHIDLRNRAVRAGRAHAGCGHLLIDQPDQLRNGRMMRVRNQRLRARIGHRPDCADTLLGTLNV